MNYLTLPNNKLELDDWCDEYGDETLSGYLEMHGITFKEVDVADYQDYQQQQYQEYINEDDEQEELECQKRVLR